MLTFRAARRAYRTHRALRFATALLAAGTAVGFFLLFELANTMFYSKIAYPALSGALASSIVALHLLTRGSWTLRQRCVAFLGLLALAVPAYRMAVDFRAEPSRESVLQRAGNCDSLFVNNWIEKGLPYFHPLTQYLALMTEDVCRVRKLRAGLITDPQSLCPGKSSSLACYKEISAAIIAEAPFNTVTGPVLMTAVGTGIAADSQRAGGRLRLPIHPARSSHELAELAFASLAMIEQVRPLATIYQEGALQGAAFNEDEKRRFLEFERIILRQTAMGFLERIEPLLQDSDQEIRREESGGRTRTLASSSVSDFRARQSGLRSRFKELARRWGYPDPLFEREAQEFLEEFTERLARPEGDSP